MSWKAILVGLALAAAIAGGTYFNDVVVRQTYLIGYFAPVSVLGVLVALGIGINPLLRRFTPRLAFAPRELAVVGAIGLAACGWPGMNFFRTFVPSVALPAYLEATHSDWAAAGALAYVPGGPPRLAPGHLLDPQRLCFRLNRSDDADAARVRAALTPAEGAALAQLDERTSWEPLDSRALLTILNALIERGGLSRTSPDASELDADQHRHDTRAALSGMFPGSIAPAPRGEGALLAGGDADSAAVTGLLAGHGGPRMLGPTELPWTAWWPTLRLWGSVALLFGLSSLGLTLIVHPQWSNRELLPYPLMRFGSELLLGSHVRNRLFWWGFGLAAALHLINGLHAWMPALPSVPLSFDFTKLHQQFPSAAKVPLSYNVFVARVCLSAIAFAYFLPLSVSSSLAGTALVWVILGAALLSQGVAVTNNPVEAGVGTMLRFGAAVAMASAVVYAGRRYYLCVVGSALGIRRTAEVPAYSIWGCRLLVLCSLLAVLWLERYLALPLLLGGALWVLMLVMVFVIARVTAETGAFCFQLAWSPTAVLAAATGFATLGPTPFIAIALTAVVLVGNPREALMPYLVNGMNLVERVAGRRMPALPAWQGATLVGSFLVALLATLLIQYNLGVSHHDPWVTNTLPSRSFDALTRYAQEQDALGVLQTSVAATPLERLRLLHPDDAAWRWAGAGFAVTLACALARLRLSWWPVHPVLFVLVGAEPGMRFAWSFALGWLVKLAVVRLGGARAYHAGLPFVVGVIAGELLAALSWLFIGWTWYLATEQSPPVYSVWPN